MNELKKDEIHRKIMKTFKKGNFFLKRENHFPNSDEESI